MPISKINMNNLFIPKVYVLKKVAMFCQIEAKKSLELTEVLEDQLPI